MTDASSWCHVIILYTNPARKPETVAEIVHAVEHLIAVRRRSERPENVPVIAVPAFVSVWYPLTLTEIPVEASVAESGEVVAESLPTATNPLCTFKVAPPKSNREVVCE